MYVCAVTERADRPLPEKDITCIHLHLIEEYSNDDPDFLNSICSSCHLKLSKKDKNDEYCLKILAEYYDPKREKKFAVYCKM